MKKAISILVFTFLLFGFSQEESNPFLGFWEYEIDKEKIIIVFADSMESYFVSASGEPFIPLGVHKYVYTEKYFIQYLKEEKDTLTYSFLDSNKIMFIGLDLEDTLFLKKMKP